MTAVRPDAWFFIVNPVSGNGKGRKRWPIVEKELTANGFDFEHVFSEFDGHAKALAQAANSKGYRKLIAVGGDGTIHHMVNGIMAQTSVTPKDIALGVIPIGTGNDWIRTYDIPKESKAAIALLKTAGRKLQDVGRIRFKSAPEQDVYFNNLAGIGFDAEVVNRSHKFKSLGGLAYLVSAFLTLLGFKRFHTEISGEFENLQGSVLMVLVGLCRYSGGGMQLTSQPDPADGLFDISMAKDFGIWDLLPRIMQLFSGKITNHPKVETLKSPHLKIGVEHQALRVQADGELIGFGDVELEIMPKALQVIA